MALLGESLWRLSPLLWCLEPAATRVLSVPDGETSFISATSKEDVWREMPLYTFTEVCAKRRSLAAEFQEVSILVDVKIHLQLAYD